MNKLQNEDGYVEVETKDNTSKKRTKKKKK
jgi:hypothetical protein